MADNGLGDAGGRAIQCALLRAARLAETGTVGGVGASEQFDIDLRFNGIGLEVREQLLPAAVKALSAAVDASIGTGQRSRLRPDVKLRLNEDEEKKKEKEKSPS